MGGDWTRKVKKILGRASVTRPPRSSRRDTARTRGSISRTWLISWCRSLRASGEVWPRGEDRLFEAMVEFPDGHREKVWAVLNEEGSLTIMLPEDY